MTPNEKFQACVERAHALPREVRNRLQSVPTVPYEAFLMWDPEDLRQNRPLTFYRRLKSKRFKGEVIYSLPVAKEDAHECSRKKGSNRQPQYRRRIHTTYKGKTYQFYCSTLTVLCIFQFRRENPRINVVEHLNGDSMDDRPSNLLLSTQSVNCRRSEKIREQARKNLEVINARRRAKRKPLSNPERMKSERMKNEK